MFLRYKQIGRRRSRVSYKSTLVENIKQSPDQAIDSLDIIDVLGGIYRCGIGFIINDQHRYVKEFWCSVHRFYVLIFRKPINHVFKDTFIFLNDEYHRIFANRDVQSIGDRLTKVTL